MRILYVIDSLGAGGAEQSTLAMVPLLARRGHEIGVVTLYESDLGDEARMRDRGFDVQALTSRSFPARVRELRRRIKVERPDVVHTSLFAADMVGRLAGWHSGSKVVSSFVSTPYDPARLSDPNVRKWKLRMVQVVDAVTGRLMVDRFQAVSEGAAEANARDLRIPASRIQVVQRGRSRDRLGEWSQERRGRARTALGLGDTTPLVLAVGRQEHQKAHADLVAAAEILVDRLPDVRVLIAGRTGNASTRLERALRENPRAAAAVELLGHRTDVPDLLCAADVLAIPSLFEGTAGAALEAMALRCPVVCTDIEGVCGVLEDGANAVLVPVSDPDAMAAGLLRVLTDHTLADRLRARGLADFEGKYTIEAAADAMEAFYGALTGRGADRDQ